MYLPCKEDVEKAYRNVKRFVHRTPVLTSRLIDGIAGCSVFFKCENFQRVGAFKFRGASNAVLACPIIRRKKVFVPIARVIMLRHWHWRLH